MSVFEIKVPATSANLGLGFDSMGIALERFLTIKAKPADTWHFSFTDPELLELPANHKNLVAQTAMQVAKLYGQEMPSLQVEMSSQIPLTHGQGSSSSAIVAGIELANHYLGLDLSEHDKILIGSQLEGHPDNVGPCVTGGAFVGYYNQDELFYYSFRLPGVGLITSAPAYEISTEEARRALPDSYSRDVAVNQNALNNVMIMALRDGDFETMGTLMMRDQFHEPYRRPLIKEFDQVKAIALEEGAYATVISGAGPSILTLCPEECVDTIVDRLNAEVKDTQHDGVAVYYPN